MTSEPRGKMVNGFDPARLADMDPDRAAAIARRLRLLGPAYRLFYEDPVQVSRGQGTRLFDRDGQEYLDAYNNVASVGHCHPHVVASVARQMETLVTHTRYIQDGILDYAETLLPSFGGQIAAAGHMMFTCTGSEANDLAMRIARHATGRRGIIVTAEAYHGTTDLTAGFSPALGEKAALGTWVRTVPAPHDGDAQRMAEAVTEQAWHLKRHGEGLAAFIADSLFSSDGIFPDPAVLGPVADAVRRAGGLYVADEVQSGFGRTGDRFWGYQRHGVDPDIVTMGKPMGNGYPVAGLAVVPEAIAAFGRDIRYFNTFGGNGAAIAAAQAVLDVIRTDRLQDNALRIGARLRDRFRAFAGRFAMIGDVRGAGLYLGVDIMRGGVPDAATAARIVNALRARRVLISATGPLGHVLKIRPPLVFSDSDADWLLHATDAVLSEIS